MEGGSREIIAGVLGSRASKKSSRGLPSANGVSGLESVKTDMGMFATATNSYTFLVYPSTTNATAFGSPHLSPENPNVTWEKVTFQPASPARPTSEWTDCASSLPSTNGSNSPSSSTLAMDAMPNYMDGGLDNGAHIPLYSALPCLSLKAGLMQRWPLLPYRHRSSYGLTDSNPSFAITGVYHMYVSGNQQLFDYGNHGSNNMPWYDPAVSGAYWIGLALEHYIEDTADSWASMRTSWTDINGWYVATKVGALIGHASYGNLDGGDFVIDFAGARWAGELGSGDDIADGYFTSQDSPRWTYYRTRTEGWNTLVVNKQNQLVTATPTCKFASSDTR
ncbi:hypothetical protein M407DRAFT_27019 [Tulasnella calospora MUT 4182]|uniref:Uncharacterized protein n=1 Tax=Tulasnella calospora MUT 4182 TaxID=1051891 RepID=A0A0C3QD65_9AGAM|nr:hypothetical protein M407DRAFT_27019 [Tulasnella calospora MUT 4182]